MIVQWNRAIVFSIARYISLFSITQAVIVAHIPFPLNDEFTNATPQFERWNFIWLTTKTKRRCHIKQMSVLVSYKTNIMNVFIREMVRIFSFGERWNVPIHPTPLCLVDWNTPSFTS